MTEKLKKCPFCGGEAHIYKAMEDYPNWVVECMECRIGTSWHADRGKAIKLWNARAADENPPLTLDELRQMVGKPIYIVVNAEGFWCIISNFCSPEIGSSLVSVIGATIKRQFRFCNYGKTWLAYKRKPEALDE